MEKMEMNYLCGCRGQAGSHDLKLQQSKFRWEIRRNFQRRKVGQALGQAPEMLWDLHPWSCARTDWADLRAEFCFPTKF